MKTISAIENDELMSLNENLYDEFYIQELEYRLETDPLAMGGILEMFNQDINITQSDCIGYTSCTGENTGGGCGIHLGCDCVIKFW
ncbi:MAG: hypothetical protein LBR10_15810 [Prevotellaceae bacterium]|jgi:hypothetical protein|nr:hypothetical protein [Prevotellaceae bacterium]